MPTTRDIKNKNISPLSSPLLTPFFIISSEDLPEAISTYLPNDIPTITVKIDDNTHWSCHSNTLDLPLNFPVQTIPLNFCIGLLAVSTQAKQTLEKLRQSWSENGRIECPPLIALDAQESLSFMYSRMFKCIQDCYRHQADLHSELSLLREQYTDLQDNFRQLEKWLINQPVQPRLAYHVPAKQQVVSLPANDNIHSWKYQLIQSLPISSLGLVQIDLFPVVSKSIKGSLHCQLFILSSDRCVGQWHFKTKKIRQKVISLPLERALSGHPENLELRIRFVSPADSAMTFKLGQRHPTETCQINQRHWAPLALSLWTTIPGTRHDPEFFYHQPSERAIKTEPRKRPHAHQPNRFLNQRTLSPENLISAKALYIPGEYQPDITFFPQTQELQVHAIPNAIAIALLADVIPASARKVTSVILLANDKANEIEFNMLVSAKIMDYSEISRLTENNQAVTFAKNVTNHNKAKNSNDKTRKPDKTSTGLNNATSGWQKISPATSPSQLKVEISHVISEERHLYLLTRVAPNSTNNYAWSRFSQITCEC